MLKPSQSNRLPHALSHWRDIKKRLADLAPVFFLDYDGTLSPIAPRPEFAVLQPNMRQVLTQLAQKHPVAIISGRDRLDVAELVAIDELAYAGSHGFDIALPSGCHLEHPEGLACLPHLATARQRLENELNKIPGLLIENKRFAVAVHFRRVPEIYHQQVAECVERICRETAGLRRTGGKKVFELRPNVEWDKGRALEWLWTEWGYADSSHIGIFIGDDLTDEDAFRALDGRGLSFLVADEPRPTWADYSLNGTEEVGRFLKMFFE